MRQLVTAPLCALILGQNVRSRPGESESLFRLGESASRDQLERQGRTLRSAHRKEPKASKVKIACEAGTVVVTGSNLGMVEVLGIFEDLVRDARRAVGVYDIRTWEKMRQDRYAPKRTKTAEEESSNGCQA